MTQSTSNPENFGSLGAYYHSRSLVSTLALSATVLSQEFRLYAGSGDRTLEVEAFGGDAPCPSLGAEGFGSAALLEGDRFVMLPLHFGLEPL